MITAKQIQASYNNLYACLRNYIWSIQAVSAIADLEVESYRAFPDKDKLERAYKSVSSHCKNIEDDDKLTEQLDNFKDILNNCTDVYTKLDTRVEGSAR